MKWFKKYGEKPFRLNKLPESFKKFIHKWYECGIKKFRWLFDTQDFIFSKLVKADCELHDLCYNRGGNLLDKIHCDWVFYKYMANDGAKATYKIIRNSRGIINFLLNYVIAVIIFWFWEIFSLGYFIAVSIFGLFSFEFGEYKTLKEIKKKTLKENNKK